LTFSSGNEKISSKNITRPYPELILRQGINAGSGTATIPGFYILHWQLEYPVTS
jgi:hypothetical protein